MASSYLHSKWQVIHYCCHVQKIKMQCFSINFSAAITLIFSLGKICLSNSYINKIIPLYFLTTFFFLLHQKTFYEICKYCISAQISCYASQYPYLSEKLNISYKKTAILIPCERKYGEVYTSRVTKAVCTT